MAIQQPQVEEFELAIVGATAPAEPPGFNATHVLADRLAARHHHPEPF